MAKRGFTRSKAEQIQVQPNDILVERSGGGPKQPVGRVVMIREEMPETGFANFVQTLESIQILDGTQANARSG